MRRSRAGVKGLRPLRGRPPGRSLTPTLTSARPKTSADNPKEDQPGSTVGLTRPRSFRNDKSVKRRIADEIAGWWRPRVDTSGVAVLMAHGQPVLARLQLSRDAGRRRRGHGRRPCQDRAGVGKPMQREHGVAGTLGGHDVGGDASDLEVIGIYLPASGEVGLRTVAIDRPPPDPGIRAN